MRKSNFLPKSFVRVAGDVTSTARDGFCPFGRNVQNGPVPTLLHIEKHGRVRAQRFDPRQLPVDTAVRDNHRVRIACQPRFEDGLEIGRVVVVGVGLNDVVPSSGWSTSSSVNGT